MKIKLYNSLSRKIEDFSPIHPTTVSIYSCGPTVYSYAHIGNMRAFLFADLLQRIIRTVGGYDVKWVMNITNIDDKTIRDSQLNSVAWHDQIGQQTGEPLQDLLLLTKFYQNEFLTDIEKLGINKNHFFAMPRATDYILEMQELIRMIMRNGCAYIAGNSVYFNVSQYRKTNVYGKLFKIDFDNFKAGVRIDSDQYEREQVSDFVLWKEQKPGEPFWDFEIDGKNYPGRPGWHIECSAMEHKLLGLPFDIHTGGIDLKFPHHEDEIAQSKAGYGIEPTNFWCHNEFLEVEGTKMSKSAGNFFTLRDLENKDIDPIDVRYAMLAMHYRTKFNFTFNGIYAAKKARLRVQEYINHLSEIFYQKNKIDNINENCIIETQEIQQLSENILEDLANDLHTPKALAKIFTFINNHNVNELDPNAASDMFVLLWKINHIFSVWKFPDSLESELIKNSNDEPEIVESVPENISILAQQRLQAKKDKDFTEADRLRNEINSLGYTIIDTKDGFEIKKN